MSGLDDTYVSSGYERFMAQEVVRLQDENRTLRRRITFLSAAISELSAQVVYEVSPEQVSLLAHEGRQQ